MPEAIYKNAATIYSVSEFVCIVYFPHAKDSKIIHIPKGWNSQTA